MVFLGTQPTRLLPRPSWSEQHMQEFGHWTTVFLRPVAEIDNVLQLIGPLWSNYCWSRRHPNHSFPSPENRLAPLGENQRYGAAPLTNPVRRPTRCSKYQQCLESQSSDVSLLGIVQEDPLSCTAEGVTPQDRPTTATNAVGIVFMDE